jgi:hypothetical protein
MLGSHKKRTVVAAVAALSVAAGGTALAASSGTGTGPTAFFDAVAKHLGISSDKLQEATKAAATEQVDSALAAGDITQAQADEMKARIAASEGFGLRGFGMGPGGPGPRSGGHLDDAATYLGLTEASLRTQLAGGKTLAEVAEAQGKTVAGLKVALLASEKEELAQAVADGRLTQAQADEILANADSRFDAMIDGTLPAHGPGGRGGFGGFGPPPTSTPSASATSTEGSAA